MLLKSPSSSESSAENLKLKRYETNRQEFFPIFSRFEVFERVVFGLVRTENSVLNCSKSDSPSRKFTERKSMLLKSPSSSESSAENLKLKRYLH
jgi:hypothetical protein